MHFANDQGARARLDKATFQVISGGNAAWVSTLRPDGGIAEVFVDGVKKDTVDLYGAFKPAQVVWALNGVSPGTHTVVVQLTGTKNTASTGTRVDLDAFVVLR